MIKYLEKRMTLDQPVKLHLTGCPNSCAQHYIGDIGCLGVKAKVGGEPVDGSTFSWAAVLAGTRRWGVRFSPA